MRRGAVRLAVCGGSRKSCTFQEQDSAGSILYISGPGDKCWGEYFLLRLASVIVCRSSAGQTHHFQFLYLRQLQFFPIEVVHIVPPLGPDNILIHCPWVAKYCRYTKENVNTVQWHSSHPKTNIYWGFVRLFLALNTNYNQLCSRKYVKILLRPF